MTETKDQTPPVKIELHPAQAHLLWNTLKDLLSQDAEGKNQGTGGIFYPRDASIMLNIMEKLAKELDTYRIENKPSKPTLSLV